MSLLRKILPQALLVAAAVACWIVALASGISGSVDIAHVEEEIARNEKLGTYKNVIDLYDEVIAEYPEDMSWYERKADAYDKMGWTKSYVSWCQKMASEFPENPSGYRRLMDYYVGLEDYGGVIDLYESLPDALKSDEQLQAAYKQYEYTYNFISGQYEEIEPLTTGYGVVTSAGLKGYVNSNGKLAIGGTYDDAHAVMDNAAAVKQDDEWFIVDLEGDRVHASFDTIEDLYSPSEGFTLAKVDGKYGYYDESLENPAHFEYDDATSFLNGIAAVCKDGKWAFVNSSFDLLTDYEFEEVVVDYARLCSRKGMMFAGSAGNLALYGSDGKRIGSETFEDAKLFRDDLAAICQDGKWGFVDGTGTVVIPCVYDDADSFNNGIAPVKSEDLWGFIDRTGEMVVEPSFDEASALFGNGIAAVKTGNAMRYIKFYKFSRDA